MELTDMLARDFPAEPMPVAHCLFAVFGRKGA